MVPRAFTLSRPSRPGELRQQRSLATLYDLVCEPSMLRRINRAQPMTKNSDGPPTCLDGSSVTLAVNSTGEPADYRDPRCGQVPGEAMGLP